jgi:tetratricopeptide (TPR) repeat protein
MLLRRFREELRSSDWAERDRAALTAGLAILQVIARRIDPNVVPDASDVDMARAVISILPYDSATASALMALLHVVDQEPPAAAAHAVMAYGRTLEEQGAYAFAADVYQLAAELGRREHGLILVPAALDRVGICLRSVGRFREAIKAYRAAIAVAQEVGDDVAVLLVSIGLAKVEMHRNRYDSARRQLDHVIAVARARDSRHPLSIALHDRGAVANHDGDLEGAFIYLDEALQLVAEPAHKVRILNDLGNLLRALGMPEVARDAFECVRDEGTKADVRWSATINLLAVASDQGHWEEFDRLRESLAAAPLTPRLRCEFVQTLAEGLESKGHAEAAREAYRALDELATRFDLIEFVEVARSGIAGSRPSRPAPQRRELPPRCRPTMEAIRARRVLAGAR